MGKYLVKGSIVCVIEAEDENEAEAILDEYLMLADVEDGIEEVDEWSVGVEKELDDEWSL